ncbi:MAG: endolytic transglycosylase MltG [Micropepsaceae bacterium]
MAKRLIIGFVFLISLGIALAVGALRFEESNFAAPGPAGMATILTISTGAPLQQIATQLESAGVLEDAFLFRIGVMRREAATELKAGEYLIPANASMARVLEMLRDHEAIQHRITIAEGLTSTMALAIVLGDPILIGEAEEVPPEGSLLPETYLFERGTTRQQIIERMRQSQVDLLAELWPTRNPDLPFDTMEDAIILASIVEKETSLASERPRIASVFVNRLRIGMRLESDPTIIYGLTGGEPLGRGLRVSEIEAPNEYSTYQIDRFPPTPICNPGRDAIAAVLNPADGDELYFVADGTGGHAFARTYNEHLRNVAAWRRMERNGAR